MPSKAKSASFKTSTRGAKLPETLASSRQLGPAISSRSHLVSVSNLCALPDHCRDRAVLCLRQFDCLLEILLRQTITVENKLEMDLRVDSRVLITPLPCQVHFEAMEPQ